MRLAGEHTGPWCRGIGVVAMPLGRQKLDAAVRPKDSEYSEESRERGFLHTRPAAMQFHTSNPGVGPLA